MGAVLAIGDYQIYTMLPAQAGEGRLERCPTRSTEYITYTQYAHPDLSSLIVSSMGQGLRL